MSNILGLSASEVAAGVTSPPEWRLWGWHEVRDLARCLSGSTESSFSGILGFQPCTYFQKRITLCFIKLVCT